jgi:hypothetical protein
MRRFLGLFFAIWLILTVFIGVILRRSYSHTSARVFVEVSLFLVVTGCSISSIYSGVRKALAERGDFVFWNVLKAICSTGIPWDQRTGYDRIGSGLFLLLLAAGGFYVFFVLP